MKKFTEEEKAAGAVEEQAYLGKWSVEEPTVLKGIEGDKGLGRLALLIEVARS